MQFHKRLNYTAIKEKTMEQSKLDRINELYKKSKAEGLTPAEKEEQQKLRQEYVKLVHNNLRGQLENVSFLNPDGTVTPVRPKKGN